MDGFSPAPPMTEVPETALRPASMALVDLGARTVGIAVSHLREVMAMPERLEPLPSSVTGVAGCVVLRGQVIPVVDLAAMIGDSPALDGGKARIVVILCLQDQLFGICAAAANRIVPAQDIRPQPIRNAATGLRETLLATFALIGAEVIPILDVPALAGLGLPLSRDDRVTTSSFDRTDQFLLFEMAGISFALPIIEIEATVPETEIERKGMDSRYCDGTLRRLGREIAVVDAVRLAGLAPGNPRQGRSSAVVLRLEGERRIALRADRIYDITHIRLGDIAPLPRLVCTRPELFSGVVPREEGSAYFLLNHAALRADPALLALGATAMVSTADADLAGRAARAAALRSDLALLMRAGEDFALPATEVREILPMQAAHHPSGRLGHLGNVSHRKRLLPIFSLAELQGLPPTTFDHRAAVVVTRVDGDDIGLAVEALIAVEHVGSYGGKTGPSRNFVYRKMAADQGLLRLLGIEELPLGL